MGLLHRFRGERAGDDAPDDLLANDRIDPLIGYAMLFSGKFDIDADALILALRSFHVDMSSAKAEMFHFSPEDPVPDLPEMVGLCGWGRHVIQLVGITDPIPEQIFDACVIPSHISAELKADARDHRSHILLTYAGFVDDPLERYTALTAAAVCLSRFDGLLLLNHPARTAFPAEALLAEEPDSDSMQALREMPLPLLYCGFVKIEVDEQPGVWMRTFGGNLMKLPDLALNVPTHQKGNEVFELFSTILRFLRENQQKFAAGDSVQFEEGEGYQIRSPREEETWLMSEGEMLVLEAEAKN